MLVLTSLLAVAICTVLMIIIVSQGIYDPIKVDLGFRHYAEKPDSAIGPIRLPDWMALEMPLNTLVNFGYVVIGLFWIIRTYLAEKRRTVGSLHAYFAYTFGWMSVFYGPIQLVRILTQTHPSAVLDQWVTLPFFAWTILWSKSLIVGWNLNLCLIFILSSILSYNLVFFSEFGFEIALIMHAANAINSILTIHGKYPCEGNRRAIFLGCLGFVIFILFKVIDLHLPHYGDVFTEVSGHFLSKLCGDIVQIHYAFVFFENIATKLHACVQTDTKVNESQKRKKIVR